MYPPIIMMHCVTQFCMRNSNISIIIAIILKAKYNICTAASLLLYFTQNITFSKLHTLLSSSALDHFRTLNEVALLMLPHQEIHVCNNVITFPFFFVAQHPNLGLGRLNVEDSTAHKIRHTVIARRRGRNLHNTKETQEKTFMTSAGFEPVIPTIERPQTYTLECMAAGIGRCYYLL